MNEIDGKNIKNNIIRYQSKSIHYNIHNPIMNFPQNKLSNKSDNLSSKTDIQLPIRYDGRGVTIIKGKEKRHHAIFCDELDIPKTLIHIESIENYKYLNNIDSSFDDYIYENKNFNKRKVTCCCKLF